MFFAPNIRFKAGRGINTLYGRGILLEQAVNWEAGTLDVTRLSLTSRRPKIRRGYT
jgi:hypothetical protein